MAAMLEAALLCRLLLAFGSREEATSYLNINSLFVAFLLACFIHYWLMAATLLI